MMATRKSDHDASLNVTNDAGQKAFVQVNELILHDISTKLKAYPSMDIADLLQQKLKTYHALRKLFHDSALMSASSTDVAVEEKVPEQLDVRDKFKIPANARIIRPFSTTVAQLASGDSASGAGTGNFIAIIESLNKAVATSDVLWHLGSTAVLGLRTQLVMKVGIDMDIGHIDDMVYIKRQAPNIPIPEIHGILQQQDSKRIFLLMSRAPGEPLDSKWESLDKSQKASIQEQLDVIMHDLRSIRPPPNKDANAVLGSGEPRRCKDARRQIRVASEPICNEVDFNRFLTYNPQRSETCNIAIIRSYLEADHKFTMTHGDLHPRNIMVTLNAEAHNARNEALAQSHHTAVSDHHNGATPTVSITAILDWEMCGLYTEYWEYVKALNTISPGAGCDDWWVYLPRGIGVWPKEHAVDLMLSRWHG